MSVFRPSRVALFVGLAMAAASTIPAHGATLLRWKFEQGQKDRLTITQDMQMKMVVQENPVLMKTTSTMEFRWEVTAVDDQGAATLTQTADRIRMKMQGPQGVMMEYDSESEEKPEGLAATMASVFEGLIGKSYLVKMDAQGKILEMKFPEGLAENMSKVAGGAQFGNMFSEEGMKGMTELATFPEQSLNPGDTWTRTATIKNPVTGDMTMDSTFRYVGSEVRDGRELEKIAMEMKMQIGEAGTVTVKITDQATEGTIYFDRVAGQFVAGDSKSKMKMQMTVLGQEIEQEMETKTTTERTRLPSVDNPGE